MKKLFCIAAFSALSLGGFAQELKCQSYRLDPEVFCVVSSHGNHYITHDGIKEDKDIKLMNGNVLHTEGVIETKDHFIVMKPNQCVRMDNYIILFTEEPIVESK